MPVSLLIRRFGVLLCPGVILRMLTLGLGDVRDFPFLDPPNTKAVREGWATLEEVGAVVKKHDTRLTELGRRLSRLPLDPRLGRMLIESEKRDVFEEMLIIVSGLSIMDVRERPQEVAEAADQAHKKFLDEQSDFGVLLNLWKAAGEFRDEKGRWRSNQMRKWCVRNFINYRRVREWDQVMRELRMMFQREKRNGERKVAKKSKAQVEARGLGL